MKSKFNFNYVKKNPIMFTMIIIVFGLIFWFFVNRGAPASNQQIVTSGPSEAQVAAQAQLGALSIQAQAATQQGQLELAAIQQQGASDLAIAGLSRDLAVLDIGAQERLANRDIDASLAALNLQLLTNQEIAQDQNQFALDHLTISTHGAIRQQEINADLQARLSSDQLTAFQTSSFANQIGSAKKKDRDNLIALGLATVSGSPLTYHDRRNPFNVNGAPPPNPAIVNRRSGGLFSGIGRVVGGLGGLLF